MATKAEVMAWMELWKHQEDAHKNEVNSLSADAYQRGYQDALADVKRLSLRERISRKRIEQVVAS